jgi:TetR/AcrR family transcriptional repressor of lmrAB and yxaGH operons
MSAPPKHRTAIVDAAVTLFRRQGYAGTGLADIVALSGAPKGSLYHYFPAGKAAIAGAAVEEAGRRVVRTIEALSAEAASAAELIRAHARTMAGWMEQSDFRDGCPITTVLLEMAPGEAAITEAGRLAYAARQRVVADRLIADGVPEAHAARLAVLSCSALQGALIQSRVDRSADAILVTGDELADLLSAAMPARQTQL